jgi:hypothetical protein
VLGVNAQGRWAYRYVNWVMEAQLAGSGPDRSLPPIALPMQQIRTNTDQGTASARTHMFLEYANSGRFLVVSAVVQ